MVLYISEGFMQNNSMRISPVGHAFHEYVQNTNVIARISHGNGVCC